MGVTSNTIKIGSDENNARSKTEIGGDLQVNYNVLTDADEDKEFWTGVITKHIKIGGISTIWISYMKHMKRIILRRKFSGNEIIIWNQK